LLENHHNTKKELGERNARGKSDPSTGERCPNEPDQGHQFAVCQVKCLVQASGSAVLLGHAWYFWFVMGPCE
jgi:hypothetical protein